MIFFKSRYCNSLVLQSRYSSIIVSRFYRNAIQNDSRFIFKKRWTAINSLKLFRIYKLLSIAWRVKRFAAKFIRSFGAALNMNSLHDFVLEWKTMDMSNVRRISNLTSTTFQWTSFITSVSFRCNLQRTLTNFPHPKVFEVIGSFGQKSFHQKR